MFYSVTKYLMENEFTNCQVFEKVCIDALCNDLRLVGYKMVNIIAMQTLFVVKWIRITYKQMCFIFMYSPVILRENDINFSITVKDLLLYRYFNGLAEINPWFWKCALSLWFQFNWIEVNNIAVIKHIAKHIGTMCIFHYSDVIMGTIASQITSLTIVYSTVYSGADQRKCQTKLRVTGLCVGNSPVTV